MQVGCGVVAGGQAKAGYMRSVGLCVRGRGVARSRVCSKGGRAGGSA